MKIKSFVGTKLFWLFVIIGIFTVRNCYAMSVTMFNDFDLWNAKVGSYSLVDFTHGNMGDLTLHTNTGKVQGNHFRDRIADGNTTEWLFSNSVIGAGADWNLLPAMIGTGLSFTFYGTDNSVVTVEQDDEFYYGFLGFVSDTPFTSMRIGEGPMIGLSEAYHMDNFVYADAAPVPEPATMSLFGTGLAGLGYYGRRKKK